MYTDDMQTIERFTCLFSRFALAIVYIWFGIIKILGHNPTNPLIGGLLEKTMPFISLGQFLVAFGLLEILIGICFIFRRTQLWALALLVPHMLSTLMPLFLLPEMTWTGFLVPSLEGLFIIKNVVIVALAATIFIDNRKDALSCRQKQEGLGTI
jgi:uncharacterized membrane protein YkgB